jgi:hypothetical protein
MDIRQASGEYEDLYLELHHFIESANLALSTPPWLYRLGAGAQVQAPTFFAIRSSIAPEFINSVRPTTPPHREHCTNIILKLEPVIFASFISNDVLSHLTHFDIAIAHSLVKAFF